MARTRMLMDLNLWKNLLRYAIKKPQLIQKHKFLEWPIKLSAPLANRTWKKPRWLIESWCKLLQGQTNAISIHTCMLNYLPQRMSVTYRGMSFSREQNFIVGPLTVLPTVSQGQIGDCKICKVKPHLSIILSFSKTEFCWSAALF